MYKKECTWHVMWFVILQSFIPVVCVLHSCCLQQHPQQQNILPVFRIRPFSRGTIYLLRFDSTSASTTSISSSFDAKNSSLSDGNNFSSGHNFCLSNDGKDFVIWNPVMKSVIGVIKPVRLLRPGRHLKAADGFLGGCSSSTDRTLWYKFAIHRHSTCTTAKVLSFHELRYIRFLLNYPLSSLLSCPSGNRTG
uniref:Uncharacterized protein n=1 Tax=Schizaphis graminum TaxID=13262 RepID=A0A2S2PP81_SCHGA